MSFYNSSSFFLWFMQFFMEQLKSIIENEISYYTCRQRIRLSGSDGGNGPTSLLPFGRGTSGPTCGRTFHRDNQPASLFPFWSVSWSIRTTEGRPLMSVRTTEDFLISSLECLSSIKWRFSAVNSSWRDFHWRISLVNFSLAFSSSSMLYLLLPDLDLSNPQPNL